MEMATKRRVAIALEIKRRAIEEMNKGKSIKDVASMFAVDTSTVRYWKRILKNTV